VSKCTREITTSEKCGGGGGIAVTDLNLHFRDFPVHQLERKKEEQKKKKGSIFMEFHTTF
jgi:hypothetical protein